jgi:cytochrome c
MRWFSPRSLVASSVLIGILALAIGGLSQSPGVARAQKPPSDMSNPFEGDPEAIENGKSRFSERCTFCHGTRGKGAKGPCLICGHFKRGGSNANLFATISAGLAGTQMGSFASSLSGEEIWQIIAFLRDETKKRLAADEAERPKIGASQ